MAYSQPVLFKLALRTPLVLRLTASYCVETPPQPGISRSHWIRTSHTFELDTGPYLISQASQAEIQKTLLIQDIIHFHPQQRILLISPPSRIQLSSFCIKAWLYWKYGHQSSKYVDLRCFCCCFNLSPIIPAINTSLLIHSSVATKIRSSIFLY